MKTCYYKKEDGEFSWWLPEWTDTPACKCIMSVAEGRTLQLNKLNRLHKKGALTMEELLAIRAFDWEHGEDIDLEAIKKLAKRVKVKLVRK